MDKTIIHIKHSDKLGLHPEAILTKEYDSWVEFAGEDETLWTKKKFENWKKAKDQDQEISGKKLYSLYYLKAMGSHSPEGLKWFTENFPPELMQYLVASSPFQLAFLFPPGVNINWDLPRMKEDGWVSDVEIKFLTEGKTLDQLIDDQEVIGQSVVVKFFDKNQLKDEEE